VACCLAVALVIAVLRAGWYRLFPGRRPARVGFAPPARRPAPGEAAVSVASMSAANDPVRGSGPADRAGDPVPPRAVPARQRVGFALVVAGAGWSVVSLFAMRLPLGVLRHHGHAAVPGSGVALPVVHGFSLSELLMHGPGLVAIALGALLTLSTAASRRPSHHTLTPRPERAL
jgi:hypothetical protein